MARPQLNVINTGLFMYILRHKTREYVIQKPTNHSFAMGLKVGLSNGTVSGASPGVVWGDVHVHSSLVRARS